MRVCRPTAPSFPARLSLSNVCLTVFSSFRHDYTPRICANAKVVGIRGRFSGISLRLAELLTNRQVADAAAGGGEYGIGERGCGGRNSHLPAAHRVRLRGDDVNLHIGGSFHAQERVIGKVALHNPAAFDRDFQSESRRKAVDGAALHLCLDAEGIDGAATIDSRDDAVDLKGACPVHLDFHGVCRVAAEREMSREPEPAATAGLASPADLS